MSDISQCDVHTANAADLPDYPCDICGMAVEPGEKFTAADGGLTIEHIACTRAWFRRSFGAEALS